MAMFFDPHTSHRFYIELDGLFVARFQECSGLSMQIETAEIKEGGRNDHSIKFANRASYGDITLKRGFANNPVLFQWFEECSLNTWTPRRNGAVVALDNDGSEVVRWTFFRAIPSKWDGPTWNAMSTAATLESLTLSCEWIEMSFTGPPPPPPPPEPTPPPEPPPQVLEGNNFEFDKSDIKPNPNPALDEWADYLNENPEKNILIEGHTDCVGSDSYNQGLSERRAASTKDYLVAQGVDPGRITTIGYGESRPIVDPCEDGANRRCEIKEV